MNDKKITYSEEILLKLIEKSVIKMDSLDSLCDEMDGDPRMYKMWVECVDKLSSVLERLYKIQHGGNVQRGKEVPVNTVNNTLISVDTTELLLQIRREAFGTKTREDLYIEGSDGNN